jgi:hypothetical protein
MLQAIGFDPETFRRMQEGDPSWRAPGRPQEGQLSPDGAYRWDGGRWVPNTTTGII